MARWMARGGLQMVAALVAVVSLTAGSARAADTDGDGFPDGLEIALGSDFQLATSTPTGSPAVVQAFTPSVSIFLGFQQNDAVLVSLELAEAPGSLEGKRIAFSIGGVHSCVTLDATGSGTDPNTGASASVFPSDDTTFLSISRFGDLASFFTDEGLTASVQGIKGVKIDAAVFFNDIVYADSALSGIYMPTTLPDNTTVGTAYFNFEEAGESSADLTFDDVEVSPSPAAVNATVTVKLDLMAKGINLETVVGVIDFGDGTPEQTFDENQLETLTHAYASEGVYDIVISLLGNTVAKGDDGSSVIAIDATAFAVIGDDAVVNSNNGLVSAADIIETSNGVDPTMVNFSVKSLMDNEVTGGTTEFETFSGTETQTQSGLSRDVADGLFPSRSSVTSEMVVAKTTTKSTAGQNRGVVRKTVAVGSRNAKPNDSANLKPPKTNPGVVTVSKVSGKFIFKTDSGNKPDQVTFSGSVTLPEGFSPDSPNGVRFAIGLGNVLDGVMLDAKGKPKVLGGDNKRLKKVQIKYPKLSGPATGTEVAKITVTMSTQDMDLKGFESEGITNRVREDETGRKTVDRFMQVNMLLAGEPYEAYIPVEFKLAPKGDAGSMITRGVK